MTTRTVTPVLNAPLVHRVPTAARGMSGDVESSTVRYAAVNDVRSDELDITSEKAPLVSTGHAPPAKITSNLLVFGNIVKSFIGAGLLGMPNGTLQGGYVATPIGLVLCCILNAHCILMMIDCKKRLPEGVEPTFEAVGAHAFGRAGSLVLMWVVGVTQCGFCTAYVVFVAQNMNIIVPQLSQTQWTFVVLPLIVLLSWIRHLKYIAPFAMFANACLLYGVLAVVVRTAQILHITPVMPPVQWINISGFLVFLGIAIFAFEGVGLTIPIENSMAHPERFRPLLTLALVCISALLMGFGLFEYLTFGAATKSLIVQNLPYDGLAISVMLAFCTALMISFPVQLFPVSEIIEGTQWFQRISWRFPQTCRNISRMLVCLLLCGLGIALGKSFSLCVSLIGCIGGSTMAFVLPALFHLRVFYNETSRWNKAKDWLIVAFGIIVGAILGTVSVVLQYVNGE